MTENQLHDCMLQLFYDDPIYNVYNITNIFYSLPSDIKLSYFLSMRSNHWNDYKFIFLNSWLEINLLSTDCMSLSLSGECRDNNIFVLLMKSSYIVLDYSSSLTNLLTTQEWNIAVSDEMILFRLSSTTKNLLNAWLHVSQEPIPKYDDFLSYYSRYVEITNVNSQDSLLAESVPTTPRNLPSRVLVNNSQILITTIDDLATSLFVVGKISSSMNSFEISVLFTSVWNTLCADAPSPEDISDAFITYVTRLPLEINRAITRLFDACKARMTQSKLVFFPFSSL